MERIALEKRARVRGGVGSVEGLSMLLTRITLVFVFVFFSFCAGVLFVVSAVKMMAEDAFSRFGPRCASAKGAGEK